jgi:hypothetical protein
MAKRNKGIAEFEDFCNDRIKLVTDKINVMLSAALICVVD